MAAQQNKAIYPAWRALILPGFFTLIALAILVSLGGWQLQRLAWKDALISRIEARTKASPVMVAPEAAWPALKWAEEEYRPVQAEGQYLFDRQVFVHGNADLGGGRVLMGYFVLTPLQQNDGSIIIINRGFLPQELKRDPAVFEQWQMHDQHAGRVVVTGLLRAPQEQGWFMPDDVPTSGEWFTKNPLKIGAAQNLTRVAPFIIDAFASKGEGQWPLGGLTVVSFPNKHLDYAFTWFGLAVVLVVIFILFARKSLRASRAS